MTLDEVVNSLNKQFITRYAKQFVELNKNVYPTAKNDKGAYEVPVPVVGKGGGTLITVKGDEAYQLNPPATVSVQFKNMKPEILVYRLAYPYSECEIAAEKAEYFNYLFDATINKAIGNVAATVGGADKVRFGESYCTYQRPGEANVFRSLDDGSLELRLMGSWASNTEDLT